MNQRDWTQRYCGFLKKTGYQSTFKILELVPGSCTVLLLVGSYCCVFSLLHTLFPWNPSQVSTYVLQVAQESMCLFKNSSALYDFFMLLVAACWVKFIEQARNSYCLSWKWLEVCFLTVVHDAHTLCWGLNEAPCLNWMKHLGAVVFFVCFLLLLCSQPYLWVRFFGMWPYNFFLIQPLR